MVQRCSQFLIDRDSDEEAETVGHALKSHVKGFAGLGRCSLYCYCSANGFEVFSVFGTDTSVKLLRQHSVVLKMTSWVVCISLFEYV